MRSATSSEGPRLVRITVARAQTRMAIEMHSRMNGTKRCTFREACSAGHVPPSLERSERRGLFFVIVQWWIRRSSRVRTSPLKW